MPTTVSLSGREERQLWTAEEFLDWLQPGVHADLIDGERFMHSPVNLQHADLLNFLDRLLAGYIEAKKLGRLYREVVAVRLSTRNVFLPDLAYFTNEQVRQLTPTHAPLAPTLIVEALSPRTADRDVGPKFAAYEEHGVQEYWVLAPEDQVHRFYCREGQVLVEFGQGEEIIWCRCVPKFWVKRSWLDARNLPEVGPCLKEILEASVDA